MPALACIVADLFFDGRSFKRGICEIHLGDGKITGIIPRDAMGDLLPNWYDARGSLVLPGLINTHVHIARAGMFDTSEPFNVEITARNMQKALRAGITTVGEMCCPSGLVRNLRDHVRANPLSGPDIICAGPILTAPGGYPLDWVKGLFRFAGVAYECGGEYEARKNVQRVAGEGMDHVKLAIMHQTYGNKPIPTVTPETARAIVDEAHRLGLRVLAHAHSTADYEVALGAGVDALMHSNFEPLQSETLRKVCASGIAVCPTLWVFESVCLAEEIHPHHDRRYTDHVPEYVSRDWSRFMEAFEASEDLVPEGIAAGLPKATMLEAIRNASANTRLLHDSEVPIAFGNDGAYGFSLLSRPIDELISMHKSGLDVTAVYRAATTNAAALLAKPDRGSLEPGKLADIIVVPAVAESNVAALEQVTAVIKGGKIVPAEVDLIEHAGSIGAYLRGSGETLINALPNLWR